jgi:hypothetical protein
MWQVTFQPLRPGAAPVIHEVPGALTDFEAAYDRAMELWRRMAESVEHAVCVTGIVFVSDRE